MFSTLHSSSVAYKVNSEDAEFIQDRITPEQDKALYIRVKKEPVNKRKQYIKLAFQILVIFAVIYLIWYFWIRSDYSEDDLSYFSTTSTQAPVKLPKIKNKENISEVDTGKAH